MWWFLLDTKKRCELFIVRNYRIQHQRKQGRKPSSLVWHNQMTSKTHSFSQVLSRIHTYHVCRYGTRTWPLPPKISRQHASWPPTQTGCRKCLVFRQSGRTGQLWALRGSLTSQLCSMGHGSTSDSFTTLSKTLAPLQELVISTHR